MNQHFVFSEEKFFAIPLSRNMVVNRSPLFRLELNVYLCITTSKAQIISVLVTSCLLLIIVCYGDNASLEYLAPLLSQVKALDECSVRLKNEIGVFFGNLSLRLVPSA